MSSYKYDAKQVTDFYNLDAEREWQRLISSPEEEVKLRVHNHYLHKYLYSGVNVLEIGAGPGRFTQTLHEIGCQVLVSDISPVQLQANRDKAKELGFDTSVTDWHTVDVSNLSLFNDSSFDAIVAYGGPLSYVFDQLDQALSECHRVLNPDGLLIASVMSLWGTLHRFFASFPENDPSSIVKHGDLTAETYPGTTHFCHLFRADELRDVMTRNGFEVITLSASSSLSSTHNDITEILRANPERWQNLIDMEIEASASSGMIEAGTHMIVVARRKGGSRR